MVVSPSLNTRENYSLDLNQFLDFAGIPPEQLGRLTVVRPQQVAAWRDALRARGLMNRSVRRKMTALRAFFSFLQTYGYCGANPAHSDFVEAPAVPRDGKTVGLSPEDCRRLLNAPDRGTPSGMRDAALLAVLAYSACRVGELVTLRVPCRLRNADVAVALARASGWQPLLPPAAAQTGILLLKADRDNRRRVRADDVRSAFYSRGIVLTAYEGSRIRLSMPDRPWRPGESEHIAKALGAVA